MGNDVRVNSNTFLSPWTSAYTPFARLSNGTVYLLVPNETGTIMQFFKSSNNGQSWVDAGFSLDNPGVIRGYTIKVKNNKIYGVYGDAQATNARIRFFLIENEVVIREVQLLGGSGLGLNASGLKGLVIDSNNRIWISSGHIGGDQNASVYYSDNEGQTWIEESINLGSVGEGQATTLLFLVNDSPVMLTPKIIAGTTKGIFKFVRTAPNTWAETTLLTLDNIQWIDAVYWGGSFIYTYKDAGVHKHGHDTTQYANPWGGATGPHLGIDGNGNLFAVLYKTTLTMELWKYNGAGSWTLQQTLTQDSGLALSGYQFILYDPESLQNSPLYGKAVLYAISSSPWTWIYIWNPNWEFPEVIVPKHQTIPKQIQNPLSKPINWGRILAMPDENLIRNLLPVENKKFPYSDIGEKRPIEKPISYEYKDQVKDLYPSKPQEKRPIEKPISYEFKPQISLINKDIYLPPKIWKKKKKRK